MKIAFFSPMNFSPVLGATKNRIEAAGSLNKFGWETVLISPIELGLPKNYRSRKNARKNYSIALRNYLQAHAQQFDVVLYEYDTLPYPRSLFCSTTLFVARPALLFYHFKTIKFPVNLKNKIKNALTALRVSKEEQEKNEQLWEFSMTQADVIQVQNKWDKEVLLQNNFPERKIIIVPNGLTPERRLLIRKAGCTPEKKKCIAFVGTFDFRKGACDFPRIVSLIRSKSPDCKFKFIGTKGLFASKQEVEKFFPKQHRNALSIYPTFEPENLPELLSDCCLGVFPSYIESFGFGVLEMMAAGLPVVCYSSPGPSDFVPPDLMVTPGDKYQFAKKVTELLENESRLKKFSKEVLTITEDYCWDKIGLKLSRTYQALHHDLLRRELKEA